MKIAIICYHHFDATISLAKYLPAVDKNIEIDLFFLLSRSHLSPEIIDLEKKNVGTGFLNEKEIRNSVDKEILEYLGSNTKLRVFVFSSMKLIDLKNYKLLLELRNEVVNRKYDLIHFVGKQNWIIFLNLLINRVPKVHAVHEPYPFIHISWYRILRHRLKMKLLISSKSHLTVPSHVSYDRLAQNFKFHKEKVSIIPFGIFEIFKMYSDDAIRKADNLILHYGLINKYKGIEVLIEAMLKLQNHYPKLKLIIAGQGTINYDISTLKDTNIQIINKRLSNKEIAELNQLATIVVCPYTSASQSGVVMTSFAFGNPILATNVGALPEAIDNWITGVVIPPGNPEILKMAIGELFNDTSLIEKMRNNVIFKYSNSGASWSRIVSETYKLYTSRINEKENTAS